jgi:hypothetical protein
MRLEQLYPNFGTSSPEEQASFLASYRAKRAEDMAKPSTMRKKKTNPSVITSKIDLSDDEKMLMKLLGLSKKDIIALRDTVQVEEETQESDEDAALLLTGSAFIEEDE